MSKKRYTKATFNFLSAVDHPAQVPAEVTIIKRKHDVIDVEDLAETFVEASKVMKSQEFGESLQALLEYNLDLKLGDTAKTYIYALQNTVFDIIYSDLDDAEKKAKVQTAIQDFIAAQEEALVNQVITVMKQAANSGVKEKEGDMKNALNKPSFKRKDAAASTKVVKTKEGDVTAEEQEVDLEALNAEVQRLSKVADLSDDEKAFYKSLDGDAASEFLEQKPEDRVEMIKKATDSDEILIIKGKAIHKREVGDAVFGVFQSVRSEMDEQAAEIKKTREDLAMSKFEKQAEELFPNLPGTSEERARILKGIMTSEGLTPEDREIIIKALKSGSAGIALGFGAAGFEKKEEKSPDQEHKGPVVAFLKTKNKSSAVDGK